MIVVSLFLIILLVFAIGMVITNRDEYHHKALAQATGTGKTILAKPGIILDANGTRLADNVKVSRLILDPSVAQATEKNAPGTIEKTAEIIAEAFSLSKEDLVRVLSAPENEHLAYLRYEKDNVHTEEEMAKYNELVAAFQEEKKEYNANVGKDGQKITAKVEGVWFEEEYRRTYPLNSTLSKVIGYTTKDATTGLIGLELQYNDILRGTNGKEFIYIDENGNKTREVTDRLDGQTIITSLDAKVAKILQEEIANYMVEWGGKRVNALVIDPRNGEIIAMASDTDFDLNDSSNLSALYTEEELENPADLYLLQEAFKGRKSVLEGMTREEQLTALLQQVQINHCVSGTYEPGSTAKALTLATGIETGIIKPDDSYYCDGAIQVGKYTIHCHMNTFCGDLKPIEAFGRSCNVCFVRMVEKIGSEAFSKYQELFNLGQKTNVDLPGEANTSALIYPEDRLGEIELATNAFGQGFNVTMLQLASAYASIINGGYYYQPHVVTRIEDSAGNIVKEVEPVLVRRTVSESTAEYMREAFRYVVTNGTANGYLLRQEYDFGGKTGASEKLPRGTGDYVVSFIGGAPLHDAKFLLYVEIDVPDVEDQSSSLPAQDMAAKIFDRLFVYFNVYKMAADDAYTYDWSKLGDYKGMSDAQGGVSFVDDPDQSIDWLFDEGEDTHN